MGRRRRSLRSRTARRDRRRCTSALPLPLQSPGPGMRIITGHSPLVLIHDLLWVFGSIPVAGLANQRCESMPVDPPYESETLTETLP